jgi:hypothetical protein
MTPEQIATLEFRATTGTRCESVATVYASSTSAAGTCCSGLREGSHILFRSTTWATRWLLQDLKGILY